MIKLTTPKNIVEGIIIKTVVKPLSSILLWFPKNQKKIIEKNIKDDNANEK